MSTKINIHFIDKNKYGLTTRALQKRMKDILVQLFSADELKGVQLDINFVDTASMQELNLCYRQKNYPTNVLSFCETLPLPSKKRYLGSLVLCLPVICEEAMEQKKSFEMHVIHLLVHGCLHLLGYDHENRRDARVMEAREIAILATFGIRNPYVS